MVNIKVVVTIDAAGQVIIHKGWAEVQQWGLNNAKTPESKAKVAEQIRDLIKRSRDLEEKYFFEKGSLEGIHLITGSSEELTRKLHRPDIIDLLTNPDNIFIVKIRENDPIIRTTIHKRKEVVEWEFINDDVALLNWRNAHIQGHAPRHE